MRGSSAIKVAEAIVVGLLPIFLLQMSVRASRIDVSCRALHLLPDNDLLCTLLSTVGRARLLVLRRLNVVERSCGRTGEDVLAIIGSEHELWFNLNDTGEHLIDLVRSESLDATLLDDDAHDHGPNDEK